MAGWKENGFRAGFDAANVMGLTGYGGDSCFAFLQSL